MALQTAAAQEPKLSNVKRGGERLGSHETLLGERRLQFTGEEVIDRKSPAMNSENNIRVDPSQELRENDFEESGATKGSLFSFSLFLFFLLEQMTPDFCSLVEFASIFNTQRGHGHSQWTPSPCSLTALEQYEVVVMQSIRRIPLLRCAPSKLPSTINYSPRSFPFMVTRRR